MSGWLKAVWIILQVLTGYNLVLPFLLFILYRLTPKNNAATVNNGREADYAIIVTAYEQTHMLPEVVDSLLQLDYSNYVIYIVADKCDVTGLHFSSDKVKVLVPPTVLASNTRSHFYAINNFVRDHERLTIIDSDNLVKPDYLQELNIYFDKGYEAVQGVRNPKTMDTVFSRLDAARDLYYHFYDAEVLFGIGSSATLAGSGMAFTVELYKRSLGHLDIAGAGFDKVLQYQILKQGKRIAYNKNAIVFDEKTSKSTQLVKQRARWINTWFKYFSYGFTLAGLGLPRLCWNQFLFGLILLRPPLFMFLLGSLLLLVVNIWVMPALVMPWIMAFLCFVGSFYLALYYGKADRRIYEALPGIPRFIFFQVLSLMKVRKANKYSVATSHLPEQRP
jgi:cellulose synthase/poly-beta-1,6-N-acetylglucosamine synthase-like glycosyltransferase